ncbi:MAG: hypothetical protein ABR518_05975 [Actinomycetota bacterium]
MLKRSALTSVTAFVLLMWAGPAFACDWRWFAEPSSMDVQAHPIASIGRTDPSAVAASLTLANPKASRPQTKTVRSVLTRNPDTAILFEPGFTTPQDPCVAPVCSEVTVRVAKGGGHRTLYARAEWPLPNYYVHIWGIGPDRRVVGRAEVANSFNKETGNERTIPVSEFHVADPVPGTWRIQTRAVFGYRIPVRTTVTLAAGGPVRYDRLDVMRLADKYLTQRLDVNIVFAGRSWSKEEVAAFRDRMPTEYRTGVLAKQGSDCTGEDDRIANAVLNWRVCHFSGTESPDADGYRPYFEPIKFTYDYNFLQADDTWTKDLYAMAESVTVPDAPFDLPDSANYLALYDAHQGKVTRGEKQVINPTVSDKIDAFAVEDWIFASRLKDRYRRSFRDIETGKVRGGRFITPDPSAYFDPFYTAKGRKNLERMPHGPATSVTFFVLDTYTPDYAGAYFRTSAYHHWDVSMHMIDPDTQTQNGPDWARVWGGRYRFFFHDLGAGPNQYEAIDFFLGAVPGSASKPFGDPPIWDYENDPFWQGKLVERTARSAVTMLLYRLTPSYLYRPLPADVYFLASNNWSDCYSRPECSPEGISHTQLEKIYRPSYVEKNLSSALPGATFTTERSDPKLETYRYLQCAKERALVNRPEDGPPGVGNGTVVLVPDPTCTGPGDPMQQWLELAKARGDDLLGIGVNDAGASGFVVRRLVEENRNKVAPLRPGQLTLTNISVVWPGVTTWYLPAIVGGVALPTPNGEIWGILNNTNERAKTYKATDCGKSQPFAPGCNNIPPAVDPGRGFSYTVQHEASHFLGLLHPHDSLTVDRDSTGRWRYYGTSYRHYGDHSMAPTTYAGSFAPYSVLDQDIIQRGHTAEYLRMTQDLLADAYLLDGMKGLAGPSSSTKRKVREAGRWREMASRLFGCGDYLKAERAMRNAFLAAQGVYGPVVKARPLEPGEKVLFKVNPQRSYSAEGKVNKGCS